MIKYFYSLWQHCSWWMLFSVKSFCYSFPRFFLRVLLNRCQKYPLSIIHYWLIQVYYETAECKIMPFIKVGEKVGCFSYELIVTVQKKYIFFSIALMTYWICPIFLFCENTHLFTLSQTSKPFLAQNSFDFWLSAHIRVFYYLWKFFITLFACLFVTSPEDLFCLFVLFCFSGPHSQHMEVPRLGVESEL